MPAGMTLEERQAARRRYREHAIKESQRRGLTGRCAGLMDDLDHPGHRLCQGESRGGVGCLCFCHDASAASQVVSRRDEPA